VWCLGAAGTQITQCWYRSTSSNAGRRDDWPAALTASCTGAGRQRAASHGHVAPERQDAGSRLDMHSLDTGDARPNSSSASASVARCRPPHASNRQARLLRCKCSSDRRGTLAGHDNNPSVTSLVRIRRPIKQDPDVGRASCSSSVFHVCARCGSSRDQSQWLRDVTTCASHRRVFMLRGS